MATLAVGGSASTTAQEVSTLKAYCKITLNSQSPKAGTSNFKVQIYMTMDESGTRHWNGTWNFYDTGGTQRANGTMNSGGSAFSVTANTWREFENSNWNFTHSQMSDRPQWASLTLNYFHLVVNTDNNGTVTINSYFPSSDRPVIPQMQSYPIKIYANGGWKQAVPWVYTANGWKQALPKIYNGAWKTCQTRS